MYAHQFRCQPAGGANGQGGYDAGLSFLKQLNSQELQALMDDNERLNRLVDDLELVKTGQQEKETLFASNKSVAEYNLGLEPRLIQSRQLLAETYEQAVKIQKDFDHNKLKLDSCISTTSLDTTLAILQMEAAKSEEESEKLAEDFLSQQTDVEKFLNEYTTLRSTAHLRKVKVEKLEEIVRQQNQPHHAAPPMANNFVAPVPSRMAPYPPAVGPGNPPPLAAVPPYPQMGPNSWGGMQMPYPPANGSYAMPPHHPTGYPR